MQDFNMQAVQNAIKAMEQAHGKAFIAASTPITGDLVNAAFQLVVALGGTEKDASNLADTKLIALYSIARKSSAAAHRKLLDYLGTGTAKEPIPVPTASPYDDSALVAELVRLQGEVDGLKSAQPKVYQIGTHNAPKVTFQHAHAMLATVLHFAANRKYVFLVGEAGSGKTTGAEQVAEALGLPFYMCAKVEDETALLGYMQLNGTVYRTPFREAYEHGGCFLMDEFCASNPNAVNAINAAIANGQAPFPDGLVKRSKDFYLIAADNTDGTGPTARYPGRNVIDGASLDRFAMLRWDYDLDLERRLGAAQPGWTRYVQALRVMADNHSMAALITPRATIDGATMLSAGMAWETVAKAYLWDKMSKEDARRLQAQVDDASYRTANAASKAA